MTQKTIKGSWVALVTPFSTDGSIDFEALERIVSLHIEAKTDGLLVCGTTAESPALSHDERISIIKAIKDQTRGQLPLMLGTGSNNTLHACELTREAEKLGADAVLVVTPYYNKPPQHALIRHYQEVAAETSLPVVLYNVPGRTGCSLSLDTVLKLAETKNITAIKEASGSMTLVMDILRQAPEGFTLLSGEDALNLPIMACGGSGTISVTANIAPAKMKKFNDAALSGDWDTARKLHYELLELHHGLFVETNPLPAKAAMQAMKLMSCTARPPLYAPSEKTSEFIQNLLKKLSL